jgi:hypothetical protein
MTKIMSVGRLENKISSHFNNFFIFYFDNSIVTTNEQMRKDDYLQFNKLN